MVPKDVIAWRKLRASAWKLISGLSSGVILREESLELKKVEFYTHYYQRHFHHLHRHFCGGKWLEIVWRFTGRFKPLHYLCWLSWHVNSHLTHWSRYTKPNHSRKVNLVLTFPGSWWAGWRDCYHWNTPSDEWGCQTDLWAGGNHEKTIFITALQ